MSDTETNKILQAFELYKAEDEAWKHQTDARLKRIEKHAEYTNGKVAALVEKDIRREERERLESEQTRKPVIERAENVYVKPLHATKEGKQLILAGAAVLTAIASAITYVLTNALT